MSLLIVVACHGLNGAQEPTLPRAVEKGFQIAHTILKHDPSSHLFSASWSGTACEIEARLKRGILRKLKISTDRATLTHRTTHTFHEVRQIVAYIRDERPDIDHVIVISDIVHASQMKRMLAYLAKMAGLTVRVEHRSFVGGWHSSHPSPFNRNQCMRLVASIPREFLWLAYRYAGIGWIAHATHPTRKE